MQQGDIKTAAQSESKPNIFRNIVNCRPLESSLCALCRETTQSELLEGGEEEKGRASCDVSELEVVVCATAATAAAPKEEGNVEGGGRVVCSWV